MLLLVRAKSTILLDLVNSGSISPIFPSVTFFADAEEIISPIERARVGDVGADGDRICGGLITEPVLVLDPSGPALTGTAGGVIGSEVWTDIELRLRKEGRGGGME
jgi:hypothetical protein